MTTTSEARTRRSGRLMLNKVPEVTVWFWVIKILCTTVGESFADWINMKLGVGLVNTAWIFTAVFVVVLGVQLRLKRYVPFPYWLTVVVVSVTGTLYTDILTDQLNVPLWISSAVFSVLLAVVFGVWWLRERTLSIHSVTTLSRESFYWLTVLVTFALGTATGDWTLELTGWSPGVSVLLPLGLIASIMLLRKFGANPVLSFWLAYILTRPLGANIGDWLASPKVAQNPGDPTGLALGTFTTSLIFLGLILATVIYLTVTRSDVTETYEATHTPQVTANPHRERIALAGFGLLAVATGVLLVWAHSQPHVGPAP
ncbi:COG4705 family protein, partial [Streptomyces sp. NPDC004393]